MNKTPNCLPITTLSGNLFTRIHHTIEANLFDNQYSVETLSKDMRISRMHLYRIIKKNVNISVTSYIRVLRLRKAKEMLKNTRWNITTIAYEAGFRDANYFSRVFKKEFGLTAREFRNQTRKKETKKKQAKLLTYDY